MTHASNLARLRSAANFFFVKLSFGFCLICSPLRSQLSLAVPQAHLESTCSLTSCRAYSFALNPAILCTDSTSQIRLQWIASRWDLPELRSQHLQFSAPILKGLSGAIGLHSQGFALYREFCADFSSATQLTQSMSVGIRVNYSRLSIAGEATKQVLSVDAGMSLQLDSCLRLSVLGLNCNRGSAAASSNTTWQAMMLGCGYNMGSGLRSDLDCIISLGNETSARLSMALEATPYLDARISYDSASMCVALLCALRCSDSLLIALHGSAHATLGLSKGIDLWYQF